MSESEKVKALVNELKRREEWWRNSQSDPAGTATAVMVALAEVRNAVEVAYGNPPASATPSPAVFLAP